MTATHRVDTGDPVAAFKQEFPDAQVDEKALEHFFHHLYNRAYDAGSRAAYGDVKWFIDKQLVYTQPQIHDVIVGQLQHG